MRFQIGEFLDGAVFLAVAVLLQEAEWEELVRTVVVRGIPHDSLLGHTDYVSGWNIASIGEFEDFQNLPLDRYYMIVRGFFWV